MSEKLKLMCILAHPDDESMGTGGILARYAAEGIETYLLTATRGERGWFGKAEDYPGPQRLGAVREKELRQAARALGLKEVAFLDYVDGELDRVEGPAALAKIVSHIRRIRPDIVVTFDPNGVYGHPDHIVICHLTTAAAVAAADPNFRDPENRPPHRVSKLYYRVWNQENLEAFQKAFGDLVMNVDGQQRRPPVWQDWAITTRINTSIYWRQVWDSIACHRSQLPAYHVLKDLPEGTHKALWGEQVFYRAFSLVSSGLAQEDDLFAGLR